MSSDQLYDYAADRPVEDYPAPPTVRIVANYGPRLSTCPVSMTVDLNVGAGSTLGLDIRAAVQALAAVGMFATGDRS